MLDRIIALSLRNRVVVLFLGGLLLVLGALAARVLPVDVFPDLSAPTVTVLVEAHGMAPAELEALATLPIESALNGAPGVRRVRSSTAIGLAVIWIEFDWGQDIYVARQIVAEKLALAAAGLPPEIERPVLGPVSSIMGEVMFVALASDRHEPLEVRAYADTVLRRRLLSIAGVAQVTPIGAGAKQYQVLLDPLALRRFGVTLDEVERAIAKTNENASAGFVLSGGSEYLVEARGRIRDLDDLRDTLVVTRADHRPILLRELGRVVIGEALKRGEGSAMGARAVVIGIQKQPGANTLALTREVERALDDLERGLPEGFRFERGIFRQADFIQVAIDNVTLALRDGAILVVVIMLLFLADLRATAITLLAIPLSLGAALIAMQAIGATINTMTLGGFAIAVGALVDDAVIDVENVVRRLRENASVPLAQRRPVLRVVFEASREIRSSIVFATLIIALVFLPLFFLSGVEGRLLAPLGFAYVVALMASLAVALTVTPALAASLLPGSRGVLRAHEPALVRALKRVYAALLRRVVRRPWLVLGVSAVLLVAAVAGALRSGRAFLPALNEGTLTISAVTLPGTSLPESNRLGAVVEEILLEQPEVVKVARRTGRAEGDEHTQGVESTELEVTLAMKDRPRERFLADLRAALAIVPGMNIVIGQPISHRIDHMLSGTRASIAVKVFGDDLGAIREVGLRVKEILRAVPGVVDVADEAQTEVPFLRVRIDRQACARYGLHTGDVADALRTAMVGKVVAQVLEGQNPFDVVVRMDEGVGATADTVGSIPIDTDDGGRVPLRALARIDKERGPNAIAREGLERKFVVMANVAGRDVVSAVEDLRARVAGAGVVRDGMRIEYGGQFESAGSARRTLAILGVVVVGGIFVLLFAALGTGRDAGLVMANLPLALVGGVAGVWLSSRTISIAEVIGFITLFGIATRNGLMLVTHIQHVRDAEGEGDFERAVVRASVERLAPILMTALATGLALVPLALSGDKPGSEIQTPMAIVILAGLLSSTLLNMLVVPALYLRFGPRGGPAIDDGGLGRGDGSDCDGGPDGDAGSGRGVGPAGGGVAGLDLGCGGAAGSDSGRGGTSGSACRGSALPARLSALVVAAGLGAWVAGCAAPPRGAGRASPADAGNAERSRPPASAPDAPRGSGPVALPAVVDLALLERFVLEHHPRLAALRAREDAAAGRVEQAGRLPNPRLQVGSEVNPVDDPFREGEHFAGLSVPIAWSGRLGAAERAAGSERAARGHDVEVGRREVLAAVRTAFAEALAADLALAAARVVHATARESAGLMRRRFAAGDLPEGDLLPFEVDEARAGLEVAAAEADLRRARSGLVAALGAPGARIDGLRGDLGVPARIALARAAERLATHPRLAALDAVIDALVADLDGERLGRLPDLTLGANYRRLEHSAANGFDLYASIDLPVFDRRDGALAERAALVRAAREERRAEEARLGGELAEALGDLDRAAARHEAYERDVLPRAERALAVAESALAAGGTGPFPVLQARRALAEARSGSISARRDASSSWARVQALIGDAP